MVSSARPETAPASGTLTATARAATGPLDNLTRACPERRPRAVRTTRPTLERAGVASNPERLQHALGLAYRYLDRRERTTEEVRRQLERQGVESAVAEDAIQTLGDEGYLDDARFARLFVHDKRELERWGSERIRQRLLARGIDREVIAVALVDGAGTEEPDQHSELERAVSVLSRRFPSAPRDRRERDRALGVLIRKGYDPELALDALRIHARGGGLDD